MKEIILINGIKFNLVHFKILKFSVLHAFNYIRKLRII